MRGNVSDKLKPFLQQVNTAVAQMKEQNLSYEVGTTRQNLENLAQFHGQKCDVAFVKDRKIKITDTENVSHEISARVYNPNPEQQLPVMLHFHGGGHMCGSIELYDTISRRLAQSCQAIIITVDYRLAPEYPYPAGLNDCAWALQHYQEYIEDMQHNSKVYIIGDSAGGAICTSLAEKSLKDERLKIDKQILIYPSVDYTMTAASVEDNGHGFLLEKEKVVWYFQQYFKNYQQPEIFTKASPLYGKFSNKLPSTLIITAGCDPLRDEGEQYALSLGKVGVPVQHVKFDEMIHAYMLLNDLVSSECYKTFQLIEKFVTD